MPHDIHGTLLQVGDAVLVPAVVTQITMTEEYCNVTVETREPMFPTTNKNTIVLNAKQVVKGTP